MKIHATLSSIMRKGKKLTDKKLTFAFVSPADLLKSLYIEKFCTELTNYDQLLSYVIFTSNL